MYVYERRLIDGQTNHLSRSLCWAPTQTDGIEDNEVMAWKEKTQ